MIWSAKGIIEKNNFFSRDNKGSAGWSQGRGEELEEESFGRRGDNARARWSGYHHRLWNLVDTEIFMTRCQI